MPENRMIDLTVAEEAEWLSQHPSETPSLTLEEGDLEFLQGEMQELAERGLAAGLSDYRVGMYYNEDELTKLASLLVKRVSLQEELPYHGWLRSANTGQTYEAFRDALPRSTVATLEESIPDVMNLLGVPPGEELDRHAEKIAYDVLESSNWLSDELGGDYVNTFENTTTFGRIIIQKAIGTQSWADMIRSETFTLVEDPAHFDVDFRTERAKEISRRARRSAGPEMLLRSFLESLSQPERAQNAHVLKNIVQNAKEQTELSIQGKNEIITEYIGHSSSSVIASSPGASIYPSTEAAADLQREAPRRDKAKPSTYSASELLSFDPIEGSPDSSEQLFFFPATTRSELFEKSIHGSISPQTTSRYTDSEFTDGPLHAWTLSARGPPRFAATNMAPGDIGLFYTKSGQYTHKATVWGVRMEPYLAARISPNYGDPREEQLDPRGISRPIVVLLTDVEEVKISSEQLHEVLGYNRKYPTWNMVSRSRLDSIRQAYDGVERLLELLDQSADQ